MSTPEKPQAPLNDAVVAKTARKGSGVRLSLAERASILTLHANGLNISNIARAIGRDRDAVSKVIRESAQDFLLGNMKEYAELQLKATRIAADKGNAEPAQWALERTKVVEKEQQGPQNQGFTVKIGVILPGLGGSAQLGLDAGANANVLEGQTLSDDDVA